MSVASPAGGGARRRRALWLDGARGLAVIAMVAFHFSWDLSHFGVIETEVAAHPGWRLFAQAIAASFLLIAGVSLALASRDGLDGRAFLRRLGVLCAAAAIVTVGSYVAFPNSYIFFGILHCIAVSSVLALAFLRWPAWALGLAGAAVFVLPLVWRSAAFSHPALVWLGLGDALPLTNDFEPIFPWFAFVLWGLAAGRLIAFDCGALPSPLWGRVGDGGGRTGRDAIEPAPDGQNQASQPPPLPPPRKGEGERMNSDVFGFAARVLARLGRWSLPIYLIHQPLLFGLFFGAQSLGVLPQADGAQRYVRACTAQCVDVGGARATCADLCRCTAEKLKSLPMWPRILTNRLTPAEAETVFAAGRACSSSSRP